MNILLLDTSTNVFSIALASGGTLLAQFTDDAGPASSAKIPGHIETMLTDAGLGAHAIDAFAVTVGPGAFTGVRVGIALIKGLAYAFAKPVVPLSSLELLALNAPGGDFPICALFDAKKGEVYGALYKPDTLSQILPEMAINPEELLDELNGEILFIGDGAVRYRDLIAARLGSNAHFAAEHLHQPQASAGVSLALNRLVAGQTVTPSELVPRYLRLSEAELKKRCES